MKSRRAYLLFVPVGALALTLGLLWYAASFDQPNYTLIEPGLYLGGTVAKPPRHTAAVLNLCESPDPYEAEVSLWEPIRDAAPAPDPDWLQRMVEWIETNRRAGRITYVHCRNGVSRSGTVVVAYLMHEHDWSPEEAIEHVRTKRPIVRPNPAFMELLTDWHCLRSARRGGNR